MAAKKKAARAQAGKAKARKQPEKPRAPDIDPDKDD